MLPELRKLTRTILRGVMRREEVLMDVTLVNACDVHTPEITAIRRDLMSVRSNKDFRETSENTFSN